MRIALIAALSLVAVTSAFATEGPGSPGDDNGRAERVATDAPGGPGDNTGHALVIDPHSMLATEGAPRSRRNGNGGQIGGIPEDNFNIETPDLPAGPVLAGRKPGVGSGSSAGSTP